MGLPLGKGTLPVFLMLACLAPPAFAQEAARPALRVTWEAPEPLRTDLARLLPAPTPESGERRAASLRPWARDIRRRVPEIAAAEGYFAATVEIEWEGEREAAKVVVTPGPRARVTEIRMEFTGDLAAEGEGRAERRRELRESWPLGEGLFFRSADWEEAKRALREKLVEEDYAAGDLAETLAEVNADSAT